jgi:protein-glutamine gamma-glutamyltransferase
VEGGSVTGVPGTVGRPSGFPPLLGRQRDYEKRALASALARIPVPALLVRATPFFALALLAAAHWVALIQPAQTRRALVASLVATAAGILIALSARLPRLPGIVVRVALVAATAVITVTAIGIRFKLLMPAGWGTLSDRVSGGLTAVSSVPEWPYAGPNAWLRLTTLMAAPLALTLAAVLAFWPGRTAAGERRGLRFGGLVPLVALYGVAVAARPFDHQTLRGIGLLACLAAWLWLPRLRARDAGAAVVAIAVAGTLGLGLTGAFAADRPWVDYRHWSFALRKEKAISFDWRHSYGPLDWPRKGTTLLLIRAKQAHYWKAETLDRFDGTRWTTEQPRGLDTSLVNIALDGNPKWTETVRVTVRGLRSELVIGPGILYEVKGTPGNTATLSNGTYLDGQLKSGDTYTARAYAPDPSATQMRAAPPPDALLSRYTAIGVPQGAGFVSTQLTVGLRGVPGTGSPNAVQAIERSRYARIYQLAKSVSAGASTDYDVVRKVGAWLEANYTYSESVPNHRYPLESFLFDDKTGYCQQFSGSAALMLRMLGIPVRVASGFAPGTLNKDTKEYVVRDLDAHSWIEVWFAGIGWVPFDPTPSLAPASSQAASFAPLGGTASAARGDTKDRLRRDQLQFLGGRPDSSVGGAGATPTPEKKTPWGTLAAAGAVLAAILASIVALFRRSRTRRRPLPAPSGDPEVDQLVRLLSRLGLDVASGTTLYALERRLQRLGGPDAAEYARHLRRRRFGNGGEPAPGRRERRRLRQALAQAVGASLLVRMHLALPDNPLPRGGLKLARLQRPR